MAEINLNKIRQGLISVRIPLETLTIQENHHKINNGPKSKKNVIKMI